MDSERDVAAGEVGEAEYGPAGYLPARAAQRARKIVLREQMGLHWTIAAVVAGLLILAITVPFVLTAQDPPPPPAVPAGPLAAIDAAGDGLVDVDGVPVLVVRAGGTLRAFIDPPDGARWCPSSRRIESPQGHVWTIDGRLIAGDGESLTRGTAQAFDDALYIDPTPLAHLPARIGDRQPACHPAG